MEMKPVSERDVQLRELAVVIEEFILRKGKACAQETLADYLSSGITGKCPVSVGSSFRHPRAHAHSC